MMNEQAPKLRDPDMLQVGVALRRAALKAQALARQTETPCYVWVDGQIVNIGAPAVGQPVAQEPPSTYPANRTGHSG